MMSRERERELPLLGGVAGALRWAEELANILAGPLLTAGLAIALIDLLTDGRLLTSQPELLYAWAISQAVGVDMQLVASWDRARQALRQRRYWALVGLLLLGGALAYVGWIAAEVFSLQQSESLTTTAALARLGMSSATWLVSRAALSVVLVCLSGWTRYHPPAKVAPSLDDERATIERELTLEPLRAELRARRALGWRDVGRSIIAGGTLRPSDGLPTWAQEGAGGPQSAAPQDEAARAPAPAQRVVRGAAGAEEPPSRPPTGPGSPAARPARASKRGGSDKNRPHVLRVLPENATAEQRIRALLRAFPTMSVRTLAKRARVADSTASKHRAVWLAERRSAAASAAAVGGDDETARAVAQ